MRSTLLLPLLSIVLLASLTRTTHGFFGTASSQAERDKQAFGAVKAAVASPKTPGFPLIECEFPPLQALNKLGDGSLRSANEVDKANLDFCNKLLRSLAPLPFGGPKTWLLMSSASSNNLLKKAQSTTGGTVCSLRDGIPPVDANSVCVLLSPSARNDYEAAKSLASDGTPVVIVNGFAKVLYKAMIPYDGDDCIYLTQPCVVYRNRTRKVFRPRLQWLTF